MLRAKPYNNGNKLLLYSVETYRLGRDKYFAVTSDEMKRVVNSKSGELVSMVRPLSEGDTRQEAIDKLKIGVSVMVGVEPENQSFIAVRHHEEWACYFCMRLYRFEKVEDWERHIKEGHSPKFEAFAQAMNIGPIASAPINP